MVFLASCVSDFLFFPDGFWTLFSSDNLHILAKSSFWVFLLHLGSTATVTIIMQSGIFYFWKSCVLSVQKSFVVMHWSCSASMLWLFILVHVGFYVNLSPASEAQQDSVDAQDSMSETQFIKYTLHNIFMHQLKLLPLSNVAQTSKERKVAMNLFAAWEQLTF